MKRRFLALRVISSIYKILGVLALIIMIVGVGWILIDASTFPTVDSKVRPLIAAVGVGTLGTLGLFAIAQLIDLLIAIETNTRASTAMLQRLGKLMNKRL